MEIIEKSLLQVHFAGAIFLQKNNILPYLKLTKKYFITP